ncbi:MbtH family NRPS accessory protein [Aquincola sp. MAHUQ-54]|uniref:MbtH family NRPS accessory protein n=1 Tax=Aquincola agrisoli TaxID=3119538 RepID=A0AAW9QEX1_9BURK
METTPSPTPAALADLPEPVWRVVLSDEGRYSIWPDYKEIPWGWRAEGFSGAKQACLDHIEQVWTDMRPLSLRQAMDAGASGA